MTVLVVTSVDRERVNLGDGISVPRSWEVRVTGEADLPGTIWLRCVYDRYLRRAVAESVEVDRRGEGDEVTAISLREVRVQWAVARSTIQVLAVALPGAAEPGSVSDYLNQLRVVNARSTEEAVRDAVVLYRLASTANLAPLKFVADQLEVSVSTATRLMSRARQEGLGTDLITRETYNRVPDQDPNASGPYRAPGAGSSGPSIGR